MGKIGTGWRLPSESSDGISGIRTKERKDQKERLKANYEQHILALEDMLDTMRGTSEYADVNEVVSQVHFDEMVTAL